MQSLLTGYYEKRDTLEPVSRAELLDRMRDDLVTVLDVRPAEEFEAGRLPRAVNIPLKALRKRLHELPKNREIVAYCRGPYCVHSFEAVAQLRESGYQACRLEDGYPEWRLSGLPVEEGPSGRNERREGAGPANRSS